MIYDMYDFNSAPHKHPHLIGVSGYATAGKDSVAEVLTRLYKYERVAFADNLKAFTRAIDPIIFRQDKDYIRAGEWVSGVGDTEAKTHPEYRRLLQQVGTHARNFFGEDVWIRSALRNLQDGQYYVIPDVRFKNEAQAIKDMGGLLLRVQRPGVGPANDHISEHDLDDWAFDGYVMNDGDLVELEGEVQRVLGDLG